MGLLKRLLPPQAQIVLAGARFWRRNHIGKQILAHRREKRAAKREARRREAEGAATEGIQYEDDEDEPMTNEVILLLLRHGLTFAGGAGLLTDNEVAQLAAALATVVGLVWSAYRKYKRAKA